MAPDRPTDRSPTLLVGASTTPATALGIPPCLFFSVLNKNWGGGGYTAAATAVRGGRWGQEETQQHTRRDLSLFLYYCCSMISYHHGYTNDSTKYRWRGVERKKGRSDPCRDTNQDTYNSTTVYSCMYTAALSLYIYIYYVHYYYTAEGRWTKIHKKIQQCG